MGAGMPDFFISHAGEDKQPFVKGLADALVDLGFDVWYDEYTLKPGDSLRRSIDRGIAESKVGVVVLSPNFFKKEWPQRELDALFTLEVGQKKQLLPVWLEVDSAYVAKFSPLMADKVAVLAKYGVDHVAHQLRQLLSKESLLSDEQVERVIERYSDEDEDNQRFLLYRCLANFVRMVSYYNEYERFVENVSEEEADDPAGAVFSAKQAELIRKYQIPPGTYVEVARPLEPEHINTLEEELMAWCNGTSGQRRSIDLYFDLDEWLDTDYLLVMFGIPNFTVSGRQRLLLQQSIAKIGSRKTRERAKDWDKLLLEGFERHFRPKR